MKGETAEREKLRPSLGHPDKIRLTVADAESYVLMLLDDEDYYRPMHSASAFFRR